METTKQNSSQWRTILWAGLPVYFAANIYLLAIGEIIGVVLLLAYALYRTLLSWFTKRVTEPQPTEIKTSSEKQSILLAQSGVIAFVILLTAFPDVVPLWSEMVNWAARLGETFLPVEWFGGPGNAVANPLQYFIIPFVALLLMGVRSADMGLGKGHKVWPACLVWLALPLLIWIGLLATGNLSAQVFVRRILSNTFRNGFFEEFLFRGALQTWLRHLFSQPITLTLQAILFGLWHLRAKTASMDGDVLAGLALCIVSQTIAGLALGYIFERTRNLIAPSVTHVVMNALGQTF